MSRPSLMLGAALLLAGIAFAGCPTPRGPDIGLPTLTSDDPQAEAEMARARKLDREGQDARAEELYRRFLEERKDDPLVPIARLSLGRILLERGEPSEAAPLFARVAEHSDPNVAEQGRFFGAVAAHRLGKHDEAIAALTPMVGRTIDPEDTALLLRTLGEALPETGDNYGAISIIDDLSGEALPEADRRWAREELERLVGSQASPEEIERLYRDLPKGGVAWPFVVKRAVRDADAAGDGERTRALLEVMRDNGLKIEGDFEAIAIRAERPDEANPRVVGAILSLSGRARKIGEQALRGLMLAAGLPPEGPQGPDAQQLVFRDDGGDPERAVEAVNELVSVHRAIAIIGPLDAAAAEAAAARAQELGVPLIALSPAGRVTEQGSMAYRLFPTARTEVQHLLAHAKAEGRRRVACLLPEGAYGDLMQSTVEQAASALGLEVATVVRYPGDATSFGSQVAELSQARFDAVFIADSAKRAALIAPALAAAGLWPELEGVKPPQNGRAVALLAPSVAFDHSLADKVGRYLQGAVFSVPFDASTARGPGLAFAQAFEQKFGEKPNAFAAFSHDAYKLVNSLVERNVRDRRALAAGLLSARSDQLAGPAAGFAPDREAVRGTRLLQLRGEEFVPVGR